MEQICNLQQTVKMLKIFGMLEKELYGLFNNMLIHLEDKVKLLIHSYLDG